MAKVTTRFKRQPKYGLTFIRQWREHRGYTLERLGGVVGVTHASLSRIERGLQPYGQELLEALAKALSTDVPSLLIRNPTDPEAPWTIWDQLKPGHQTPSDRVAEDAAAHRRGRGEGRVTSVHARGTA